MSEYLNAKQLKAILAQPDTSTSDGRRDQYFMIHSCVTGCRVEEVLNTRLGDILRNGDSVQIRICGKGNKTRLIPIPSVAVSYLDAYLAEFHPDGKDDDPLFYLVEDGKHVPMTVETADSIITSYVHALHDEDAAFPEDFCCGSFRRSTELLMNAS